MASPTTSARTYYNAPLTSQFYTTFWGGGTHISIGLYPPSCPSLTIASAANKTVSHLASLIQPLSPETRILDMGSGYGGSARHLAREFGCHVTCLNLSEEQNRRNREVCEREGLEVLVRVVEGSFEDVPATVLQGNGEGGGLGVGGGAGEGRFDVIWAQDAWLHSGNRGQVMREVGRVLVEKGKGGRVVVCDIMQTSDAPEGEGKEMLEAYCQRLGVDRLATLDEYKRWAKWEGFEEDVHFEDLSEHLVTHYGKVEEEMERREEEFLGKVEDGVAAREYLKKTKKGIQAGVQLIRDGYLIWGCFRLRR